MRPAEFRRSVRKQAGGTPRWALDAACNHHVEGRHTDHADVAGCRVLAERFAVSHAEGAAGGFAPGLLVASDHLIDAITPEVDRVRREVFRTTAPSFPSLARATAWIRGEAKKRPVATQAARHQSRKLMEKAVGLADEAARLVHAWATVPGWHVIPLAYATPGAEAVTRLPTWRGSKLSQLAAAARDLAHSTGFSEAAVVAYILAGIRPVLPVARLTTSIRSTRGIGASRWVTVELHSAMTPREFLKLYDRVRAELGVRPYAKPLTSVHQALREAVKTLGGEPARGSGRTAFWERVRTLMNQQHGTKYTTWRGPAMRYQRLTERLKSETNGGQ